MREVRRYGSAFIASLALTLFVGWMASLPGLAVVGVLLAPGMLGAALIFPEGINSDWASTYLIVAVLLNAFVLAWPVLWSWKALWKFRRSR